MVFRYCLASLALVAAPASALAQSYPEIVETSDEARALIAAEEAYLPQDDWRLARSQNGCSVRRDFTLGEERVTISMRQLQPGLPIQYALVGTEFSEDDPVEAGFVPGRGLARYTRLARASIGEREGFVYAGHPFPFPQGESRPNERELAPLTEFYVIQGEESDPILLRTGPFDTALEGLANCAVENLTAFGVDMQELGSALRRPNILNRNEVTTQLIAAYPGGARRAGRQGPVQIRLIVGPDGAVTHCHIADYLTARALRDVACNIMREHAEFEPALNINGEPMTGYYLERIVFQLQNQSWPNADGTDPLRMKWSACRSLLRHHIPQLHQRL